MKTRSSFSVLIFFVIIAIGLAIGIFRLWLSARFRSNSDCGNFLPSCPFSFICNKDR